MVNCDRVRSWKHDLGRIPEEKVYNEGSLRNRNTSRKKEKSTKFQFDSKNVELPHDCDKKMYRICLFPFFSNFKSTLRWTESHTI